MRIGVVVPLVAAAALSLPMAALASGFGYYEHGAKATAMAGAFVARADDVTAVFYNPAGIAFLDGTNVHLGMHPINLNFTSKFAGITTDDTNKWLTPASAFFSSKLNDSISYGFGFYVPFGLTVDWPDEWIGRPISYHTALRSYYLQPTIAFKVNEQFSVGAGVNIVYSKVELSRITVQQIPISPLLPPLSVHVDTVVEATGNGYGVNLGMLYKVNPKFNLGLSYKSEIDIDYDGDVDFTPTPTGIPLVDATVGAIFTDQNVRSNIKMPQILAVGAMFKASERFSFEVDVQWTGWSSFEKLEFDFDNDLLDAADVNNWEDVWTLRVGGEYLVSPDWAVRAGYIYDPAAIPASTLKSLLPDAARNELTFGIGYDTHESCCWGRLALDCAVQYIWTKGRTSTFTPFPSDYEANALIVGMGLTLGF